MTNEEPVDQDDVALDKSIKAHYRWSEGAWNPADNKPSSGRIVLAAYRNDQGMPRIVRAAWVAENTEEAASDNDDFSVYCEADDTFYWPEGWYEQIDNWDDYSAVLINHEVTHWRPMPEVPADMAGETHD